MRRVGLKEGAQRPVQDLQLLPNLCRSAAADQKPMKPQQGSQICLQHRNPNQGEFLALFAKALGDFL